MKLDDLKEALSLSFEYRGMNRGYLGRALMHYVDCAELRRLSLEATKLPSRNKSALVIKRLSEIIQKAEGLLVEHAY